MGVKKIFLDLINLHYMVMLAIPSGLNPLLEGQDFYNFGIRIPDHYNHVDKFSAEFPVVEKKILKICTSFTVFIQTVWSIGSGGHEFHNLCIPFPMNTRHQTLLK